MRTVKLALVGFGNVGQAFARLLQNKQKILETEKEIRFLVTGILTGRHGAAFDPNGLDLNRALELMEGPGKIDQLSVKPAPSNGIKFIKSCPADIMIETTPVNHHTGQPAIDHLKTALECGMHAVTANKGPVVHGFDLLQRTAEKFDRRFLFESSVMDGAPIFSLFRETLPLAELRGFRGILNSCTNMIIGKMETGMSLDEAIAYGQTIGITETDPSADVDGWDASIKVAALATVLMGIPTLPQDVDRTGIRVLTREDILTAAKSGKRWKLVCEAKRDGNRLVTSVKPEQVSPDSVLYAVNGTSSYCQFELDTLPGLGVVESDPGPTTTAYGMFADCLRALGSIS